MIKCPRCNKKRPLSGFNLDKNKKNRRQSWCKLCQSENSVNNAVKNIEKWAAKEGLTATDYRRRKKLARRYGMTLDDFSQMIQEQNGVCAICGLPESKLHRSSSTDIPQNLTVDHCHQTNKVRGLLCDKCNLALSLFCDDIDVLASAISYLRNVPY